MGRGIAQSIIKKQKDNIRNNINPYMYESSFPINFKYTDKETFVNVYNGNNCVKVPIKRREYNFKPYMIFTIEAFKLAGELSKMAYRLLGYILEEIPIKGNLIVINSKICAPIIGTKYDYVVSNAKKELIDKGFIKHAKDGRKDEYNINIDLFFKGDRNNFIFEYGKTYGIPEDGLITVDNNSNVITF